MSAIANTLPTRRFRTQPLPPALDHPTGPDQPHRRQAINGYRPARAALERFNGLLAVLGRHQPPLDLDQLATAARQLPWPEDVNEVPGCISQRVARLETVAAMVADPHWEVANEPRACARRVLDYAHDAHPLIPHGLPRFGRLDEAIVVEAAWPVLGIEAACYQDFLRLRLIESSLRGCSPEALHFDRRYFEEVRRQEAQLSAHRRRVRESSYVPAPPILFRIH